LCLNIKYIELNLRLIAVASFSLIHCTMVRM
jgi:hypothetical protein